MVNPGVASEWEEVAPMEYARANLNTVILLDGSLLAVGGVTSYGGVCAAVINPERYEPEEVFGIENPAQEWQAMDNQQQIRGYHSVALLLPDGTVISAGGKENGDPSMNTEQSLELFHPPYCYPEADRPEINATNEFLTATKTYGDQIEFDVTLKNSSTHIAWLGLVRNGSVTHGADMNQRYVELALFSTPTQTDRLAHVEALMPINGFYAPPGYYMLAVVDTNHKVSEAIWVRLELE
jgi:hypothetical protein